MRRVVLDTETTGIGPKEGHRIIEIGCVELDNRKLTGNHFHVYINPERLVDEGAFKVHGIGNDFLSDKPVFAEVAEDFLAFVKGAELIIHNAAFDMGFLNHELKLWQGSYGKLEQDCSVLDTLEMARNLHPGQKNNLDALCKRYDVDNSNRELHGALLDAEILALVYLAMTGGQASLFDSDEGAGATVHSAASITSVSAKSITKQHQLPLIEPTDNEQAAHLRMLELLSKTAGKHFFDN